MNDMAKELKRIVCVVVGNTIMAMGSGIFVIRSGLMTGGATGLGIAVSRFTGMPVAAAVGALNITLFLAGVWFLGRTFAWTAIISTF